MQTRKIGEGFCFLALGVEKGDIIHWNGVGSVASCVLAWTWDGSVVHCMCVC